MRINTDEICNILVNDLKSRELAGEEKNVVQKYCLDNFTTKAKIYNQIAINKDKYTKPYISVSTIAQNKKQKDMVGIDIDFAIPVDAIQELEVDGVIVYKDREKLAEIADLIIGIVESACVNHQDVNIVFSPNPIDFQKEEFSGNIEITYETAILLQRDR